MKLIIGLGNPGKKYENHRHNIGFKVIDYIAEVYNIDISSKKFKALYGKGIIENNQVILVKPLTYMNLSGFAVSNFMQYFKVDISDSIVLLDDLNIDFSRIRIRKTGSDGGHNGLKSIISCVGSKDFPRVRLGIGMPQNFQDISEYVLSQFTNSEKEKLDDFINNAKEAVISFILK